MKPEMFTSKTLPLLADGALEESVNTAMAIVYSDLDQRPQNAKPRKVQITIEYVPNVLHPNATHLEDVRVGFKVKHVTPDLGPVHVQMIPKADGLMFHPDVPEDPRQLSVMQAIDRGE